MCMCSARMAHARHGRKCAKRAQPRMAERYVLGCAYSLSSSLLARESIVLYRTILEYTGTTKPPKATNPKSSDPASLASLEFDRSRESRVGRTY